MRLAGAVGAEHGDPLAVVDLQVEGLHQAGELQLLQRDGPHTRTAALEPHADRLLARRLLRPAGLLELLQPGLRGRVAGGEGMADRGRLAQRDDELLELGVLLVPPPAELFEAREAGLAGLVEAVEAAAVHPDAAAGGTGLHRDDLLGGTGEQLAVVRDEQHGLGGRLDGLLQPALAGDVQVVVRLVQQQDLLRAAQQRLQDEPLLLTAGERVEAAELRPVEGHAQGRHGADVPDGLVVVAVGVRPVGERLRVRHLGLLVVLCHHRQLGGVHRLRGDRDPGRRDGHQQVPYGGVGGQRARGGALVLTAGGADELAHHPQTAADRDAAAVGLDVTGDHAEQGGLAGAVGAHQGDRGALPHPEGRVVEQHPPVRQVVLKVRNLDVSHMADFAKRRAPGPNGLASGAGASQPSAGRPGSVRIRRAVRLRSASRSSAG